jgi:bacteriocin biosynthesis cyclodehydratase domain-containing protein
LQDLLMSLGRGAVVSNVWINGTEVLNPYYQLHSHLPRMREANLTLEYIYVVVSARTGIAGDGPGQGEIRYVFDDVTSHQIALSTAADTHDADIAVLMGSYLIAGETAGSWLRRDIPHLLVTYDEQGATIGPLVVPGRTPCAHCVDLHRRDADPSWVALASQLLYREHPQPSAALKCAVAIEVVRLVAFRDDIINAGVHVRIRSDDLEKTVTPSEFHPDCQCRSLQENVTSLASRRANRTQMPTTV